MIIKEICLTNFGKFNNKVETLKPGMNIIYGENEAGKTTLHTFIRGMLFGIEKQRGKASGRDTYSKYEPWQNSSDYKGMMRIENKGTNYRIERNFNKDNKSFRVINEDLGRELAEHEIEKLFEGLDENCYYNTISISQLGSVTDKELEVILKNYAANLGATKSMEINIKEALTDLDAQKKKIIIDNRVGEEQNIKSSIKDLTEQLEISEHEQQTIIASIEQKKDKVNHLGEQKKELSALDSKRLEELAKQNERKDNLYQDVMSYTADVEKYSLSLEEIQEHRRELEQEMIEKGIDNWDTMDYVTDRVINKTNMPVTFIILMMACIGATIGLVLGNFQLMQLKEYWYKPAIFLGGAVVFLIASIIKYQYNKNKKRKKLEALRDLKIIMDKLDAAKHEEVYAQRQLNNKKEVLRNTQELIKAEEGRIVEAKDYSDELTRLESDEREVGDTISKAQWRLEQQQEKDIEILNRIDELKSIADKIERANNEIHAIEEAKNHIEEIANEVRNSFGKKLNERASYYMSKITNGKYDNLSIDEKLNISVNNKHSLIATTKLSKGTIEQIYMSLRLAAADIIFETDKKPILLDDAFVMYDNKRMGNTMKFMAENMEQVLIFSCHTREKVMADKLDLNYNFIRL